MDNTVSEYYKAEQAMNFGWFAKAFSLIENWYRNFRIIADQLNCDLDRWVEKYQFVEDCIEFFTYGKFRCYNTFESKMRLIAHVYEMEETQKQSLALNLPCFCNVELVKKELDRYFKRLLKIINYINWNEGVLIHQPNGSTIDVFETIDINIKVTNYCLPNSRINSFMFTNKSQKMLILEDLVDRTLKPLPITKKTASTLLVSELLYIRRKLALAIGLKEQKQMRLAEESIKPTSRFDMLETYAYKGFNVEPISSADYRRFIHPYDITIEGKTALRLSDRYVDFITDDNFLKYEKNEFFKFDRINKVLAEIKKNVNKT